MILLSLNREWYENDLRALLMAFYPGEEIRCQINRGWCGDADIRLNIDYNPDKSIAEMALYTPNISLKADVWMDFTDKMQGKIAVKTQLYRFCAQDTKKELPWGTLTGIRPTKIARTMLEEQKTEKEIIRYMKDVMLCGDQKTELSIAIAEKERSVLEQFDYKNGYSLYIGIPFCPTTCAYCSFTSYPIKKWEKQVDEYLDAVEREMVYVAEYWKGKPLHTVYFGGGTPTTLQPEQFERILTKIKELFDLSHCVEFCVEAGRPDSITREKLDVLKKYGVTRISINPQTMKEETLKLIGRRHTVEQIRKAYDMARVAGFDNINMDMILGLPDETAEDVKSTLKELSAMKPDNLTVHSLAIKRAARLNTEKESFAGCKSINSEEIIDMTAQYAAGMGMEPYYLYRQKNMTGNMENTGYSLPGKEGIYNILIMEELQPIIGIGAGATTKAVKGSRIERVENVKDVTNYLVRVDEMIDRKKKLFKKLYE